MELEQIMQRIRAGDRDALRSLIARCGGDVYQRALSETGDKARAKELTQKIFAQLVTTLQEKDDESGWQLWLDSLTARNLEADARMRSDLSYAADELERTLPAQGTEAYEERARRQSRRAYENERAGAEAYAEPARGQSRRAYENERAGAEAYAGPARTQSRRAYKNEQARAQHPPREGARTTSGADFEPERGHGAGYGFGVFVLVLLCCVLVWVAAGVLMAMDFIPVIDLGYSWFNAHAFKLF